MEYVSFSSFFIAPSLNIILWFIFHIFQHQSPHSFSASKYVFLNVTVFNCFSFTSTYSISNWLVWMLFPLSVLRPSVLDESNRLKLIIFLQCQVFVADSKKLFWITVHQNVLYIILSRLFPSLPGSILRLQGGSGRETVCHKNPLQLLSSDTELKSTSGRGDIDQVS